MTEVQQKYNDRLENVAKTGENVTLKYFYVLGLSFANEDSKIFLPFFFLLCFVLWEKPQGQKI